MVPYPAKPILIVDDEEPFLFSVGLTLESAGLSNHVKCLDSRAVMSILRKQDFSLILLDMMMPEISGEELLPEIASAYPHIPIIIITAVNKVETAVQCMKSGALDYVLKPVDDARLVTTVKRAIEYGQVRDENTLLRQYLLFDDLQHPEAFSGIITNSQSMRAIFKYIEATAKTPQPFLITGETGVGKELIAQAVHRLCGRSGRLVAVNLAGVDDIMFSDTLFGHVRGAFTGALGDRKGLIENAAAGTLFLDEIGDLRAESQSKLLRLLQERSYYPLGLDMPRFSDARIVAATNGSLEELQVNGQFRRDLYYRLKTHHVHIPPLRERPDDISCLLEHFLEQTAKELGKRKPTAPKELVTLLKSYDFPGNIRELQGLVYDAVSLHRHGILSMEPFKARIGNSLEPSYLTTNSQASAEPNGDNPFSSVPKLPTLKACQQMLIEETLRRTDGNQTLAAELLGISRKALNNRLGRSRN